MERVFEHRDDQIDLLRIDYCLLMIVSAQEQVLDQESVFGELFEFGMVGQEVVDAFEDLIDLPYLIHVLRLFKRILKQLAQFELHSII